VPNEIAHGIRVNQIKRGKRGVNSESQPGPVMKRKKKDRVLALRDDGGKRERDVDAVRGEGGR